MSSDSDDKIDDIHGSPQKAEQELRTIHDLRITEEGVGKLPGACHGSCLFWAFCCGFCFLGMLIPLCVFLPLIFEGDFSSASQIVLWVVFAVVFFLAWGYCCFSIWPVLSIACMRPVVTPFHSPYKHALDGTDRSHERITVKKISVIVNPFGGGGRALRLLETLVLPTWENLGIKTQVLKTEYAGHAVVFAQTLDPNTFDVLCIIGGDGSFHELVNGVLTRPDGQIFPIAILPGGSGNSFASDLNTNDCGTAAKRIAQGHVCWTDANLVTIGPNQTVWSINIVAVGVVGDTGVLGEKYRWLGKSRYDICGLWAALVHKLHRITLKIDDKVTEEDSLGAFVGLTQYSGEGARLLPNAFLDDGKLDGFLLKNPTRGDIFRAFSQFKKGGSHVNDHYLNKKNGIEYFQGHKTEIHLEEGPGVVNIDGELYEHKGSVTIECKHKVFRLVCFPNVFDDNQN